jgi:hypothetical protein
LRRLEASDWEGVEGSSDGGGGGREDADEGVLTAAASFDSKGSGASSGGETSF